MKKITYSIKSGDGNDAVILKNGAPVEFVFSDIARDEMELAKMKKEITAQIGIQEATKANVERTHPHIAQMTPEDLTAAYLFREATGFLDVAKIKLNEIENMEMEYAKEKAEIVKQTGLIIESDVKTEDK